MKNTNSIIFLGLSAIYTYLFYDQNYGINYLIFSILCIAAFIWKDKSLIDKTSFQLGSITTLISGACCFYYGTEGYVFENKIALLILSALAIHADSSLPVAGFHSIFTMMLSPIFIVKDLFRARTEVNNLSKIIKYGLLTIVPLIIVGLFLFIYVLSNPILSDFLGKFNFDFLSIGFIFFSGYSLLVNYILQNQKQVDFIIQKDAEISDNLSYEKEVIIDSRFNFLTIKSEIYIVVTLFIMLNLIIGLNNCLDIYYIHILQQMPMDITFSEYIHNGIYSLIASIILAILLIMYVFNSRLNFIESAKKIKGLVYFWIAQNIVLVYLCLYKNIQYIHTYGYTYKRLGVYYFLILTVIGLLFVAFKLLKNKNNVFLIRKQSWVVYLLSIVLFSYDWDLFITVKNIEKFQDKVDFSYLIDLGHTNKSLLFDQKIKTKSQFEILDNDMKFNKNDNYESYKYSNCTEYRLMYYLSEIKKENINSFPSFCISKSNLITKLNQSK